jgi:hypothetical protein
MLNLVKTDNNIFPPTTKFSTVPLTNSAPICLLHAPEHEMCTRCNFDKGAHEELQTHMNTCMCMHMYTYTCTYICICTYVNSKLIIWVKYQKFWYLSINVTQKMFAANIRNCA